MQYEHNYAKNKKEIEECEKIPHPVILLDNDFYVRYKNNAAKTGNIKLRMGTNIEKYMDEENIQKLYDAFEKEEFRILKLNALSPIKYCILNPCSESGISLTFYDGLDFLNENDETEFEIFKKIERLIDQYTEDHKRKKSYDNPAGYYNSYSNNNKRISRVKEYFMKHLFNLNLWSVHRENCYCDIAKFLNNFVASISSHINSFGYKVGLYIEDKMFLYKLNESDLLSINCILTIFAFKYSIFNKIDIDFNDCYSGGVSGRLKYTFEVDDDFIEIHHDMITEDYLNAINDITYLDLNLAAIIAKNHGLNLHVYYDVNENNVCLELLFRAKNLDSDFLSLNK